MNTNLATPLVEEFARQVPPARIRQINAALHIAERERLRHSEHDFAVSYAVLREAGFSIIALYVLYPPLLDRCAQDMQRLRSLGVDRIAGKVFKGRWNGQTYPDAYTQEQRKIIYEVTGEYRFNEPYLQGLTSFNNQLCRAGADSIKVMVTGEVRRCASVGGNLGNLYNGTVNLANEAQPCPANRILVVSQCLANLVNPPKIGEDKPTTALRPGFPIALPQLESDGSLS